MFCYKKILRVTYFIILCLLSSNSYSLKDEEKMILDIKSYLVNLKKIIAYSTGWNLTTKLVKLLANSIYLHHNNWEVEMYNIESFMKNGLPENIDAVLSYGILRNTGLVFREAAKNNIDRYYMDHAFFDAGFKNDGWLRIIKNSQTTNKILDSPEDRWKSFFEEKYYLRPWKKNIDRGKKILIIPPTSAICWYFNAHNWLKDLLKFFEKNFGGEFLRKIKIREKPNEPIVDKNGNFLGLDEKKIHNQSSLQDDLKDANLVIAYNSQVSLEATIQGIPVIVDKHNCCWPISFSLEDICKDINNEIFDVEPDRLSLVKWLSYCQFNYKEIKDGAAWEIINKLQ